jgi:multiple sugar transport system permease protein
MTRRAILIFASEALVLCFCLAPFLYMLATALSSTGAGYLSPGGHFVPTLGHFRDILLSPTLHFPRYLLNSVGIALLAALFSVAVASPAAYALTRMQVRGGQFLMFAVLSLSMFPPVSLVSSLFQFMTRLGWINTWQALVLPYVAWSMPLALWTLVSYFQQIPTELDRAALVDGASHFQAMRFILLPVAAPGVFSTGLLAFIFAFNEFLYALMLTTDSTARTMPVAIAMFEGLHGEIPWAEIMAAAAVATAPVVLLTIAFQRRIVQGLTKGAVKE